MRSPRQKRNKKFSLVGTKPSGGNVTSVEDSRLATNYKTFLCAQQTQNEIGKNTLECHLCLTVAIRRVGGHSSRHNTTYPTLAGGKLTQPPASSQPHTPGPLNLYSNETFTRRQRWLIPSLLTEQRNMITNDGLRRGHITPPIRPLHSLNKNPIIKYNQTRTGSSRQLPRSHKSATVRGKEKTGWLPYGVLQMCTIAPAPHPQSDTCASQNVVCASVSRPTTKVLKNLDCFSTQTRVKDPQQADCPTQIRWQGHGWKLAKRLLDVEVTRHYADVRSKFLPQIQHRHQHVTHHMPQFVKRSIHTFRIGVNF